MAFNVGRVKRELVVVVPFMDDSNVTMRHMGQSRYEALRKACSCVKFNPKSHIKEESIDEEKFRKALVNETVLDWDFEEDGQPFPCTQENREYLMEESTDFRLLVLDVPLSLEKMLAIEKENERKNSVNGGKQKETFPE